MNKTHSQHTRLEFYENTGVSSPIKISSDRTLKHERCFSRRETSFIGSFAAFFQIIARWLRYYVPLKFIECFENEKKKRKNEKKYTSSWTLKRMGPPVISGCIFKYLPFIFTVYLARNFSRNTNSTGRCGACLFLL